MNSFTIFRHGVGVRYKRKNVLVKSQRLRLNLILRFARRFGSSF